MFEQASKEIIVNYMRKFTQTFSANLRRYKGQLGQEWGGIDSTDCSMIIYFCSDGVHARIVPRWLGAWVKIKYLDQQRLNETCITKLNVTIHAGETCHFTTFVKKTKLHAKLGIGIRLTGASSIKGAEFSLSHEGDREASVLTLPSAYIGPSNLDAKSFNQSISCSEEMKKVGIRQSPFPWIFGFLSSFQDESVLDNFDKDPFIEAHGLTDQILSVAGISNNPGERYGQAITELEQAIETVKRNNESSIHKVIMKFPFIIVDEHDYVKFSSEPTIRISERTENGVKLANTRPDLIYDMHDDCSLIVEIEAKEKQLFKQTKETGFNLPRAESVAACFQIHNYKTLFDGFASQQTREQLGLPDRWSFKYLLVIGSTKQNDFNQSAWNNLRDFMANTGVEMRTWDYYVDRLKRIKEASNYSAQS